MDTQTQNYILLPASQMETNEKVSPVTAELFVSLSGTMQMAMTKKRALPATKKKALTGVKVIDSIHETGAKLVQIKDEKLADFRFANPGVRVIPEVFYSTARAPRFHVVKTKKLTAKAAVGGLKVKVVSGNNGAPLKGVTVVAFTDFETGAGAEGLTNAKGVVTLATGAKKFERVYIYPEHSCWPMLLTNIKVTGSEHTFKVPDIDFTFTDAVRHFYDVSKLPEVKAKVRVAVIDTGVGPHKDIVVKGGANTITGEKQEDHMDNGEGHGTHVAGIIGANGDIKGVAAGVEIYSYRVFPKNSDASNFFIMKAIDKAVADGCDLINMSLGQQGGFDEGVVSSIKDAYAKGTVCLVATGNDGRQPVSFPASYSLALAVSAMGRKDTYPADSEPTGSEAVPFGKDKKNYIAEFSNIGIEVDLTAPGVGIISTFPGDLYAVMSGTSMACPAATGMAARLLAGNGSILKLPRNQARADQMVKFLAGATTKLGFGVKFEGKGMLK